MARESGVNADEYSQNMLYNLSKPVAGGRSGGSPTAVIDVGSSGVPGRFFGTSLENLVTGLPIYRAGSDLSSGN